MRDAITRKDRQVARVISTLCHELAHLRHFDHGYGFQGFYAAILEYARDEGIYRPRRREVKAPVSSERAGEPPARAPRQLSLF